MRANIRYAGISQEMERRVCLAAKTLAAHDIQATALPWEGSGCQLVVLSVADEYGRHVLEVAQRRGVLAIAIALGSDGQDDQGEKIIRLPENASVSLLAQTMFTLLGLTKLAHNRTEHKAATVTDPSVWARLSTDLARCDLEARNGSRFIQLIRSKSRVRSSTLSDMLSARDHLFDGSWGVNQIHGVNPVPAECHMSLDVFMLDAAIRNSATLPDLGAKRGRLDHWPDFGGAPDTVDALRVTGMLMRRALSVVEVVEQTGLPKPLVNAFFWAFSASGLLRWESDGMGQISPAYEPKYARPGLFSRLAVHFGLIRH